MRPHWNPFRSRSTEQQRDVRSFLRNFGAGVLEMLPETLWDRPLVIHSAPGGGKTTLMRLFAADSLIQIADRLDDFEEGVASPGPIRGFGQRLGPDDTSEVTRVWLPVLGEHQEPYIRSIYEFLAPNEVCPVLPFPAKNPRRGDDLLLELRRLIFDTIEVEPRNFIYADERNPFDLYRGLCRLSDRYTKALAPVGDVSVVTSVHGSKVLSVGALLAAYEKDLMVVSAGPTGYRIQPGIEIDKVTTDDHLMCLWLDGEPYR